MTTILTILLLASLTATAVLARLLYAQKRSRIDASQSYRGSCMTVAFDGQLNVIEVINPQPNILDGCDARELVGRNLNDIYAKQTRADEISGVDLVWKNILDATQNKTDLFFEYQTNNAGGELMQTVCYAEYRGEGIVLWHAVCMDVYKRVEGCGKCTDYILSLGMNNLSVGVYVKRIGRDEGYIFFNDVMRDYYAGKIPNESPHWNQEQDDLFDQNILNGNGDASYEKVIYDDHQEPLKWFKVSKILQKTDLYGHYIITTVTDISDLKRREIELEAAKLNLGLALGAAGDVSVWCYKVSQGRFYPLYGDLFAPSGATMEECARLLHPESRSDYYKVFDSLLNGISQSREVVFRIFNFTTNRYHYIKDNVVSVLSSSGAVESLIGTHKDITETMLKEIEMQDMRNSLDRAIVAGNILAWQYDLANAKFSVLYGGDIVLDNDLAGLSADNALGFSVHELDMDRYGDFIAKLKDVGGDGSIIVRGLDLEDGRHTYFEINVSAVSDNQGVAVKLLGTSRDISKTQRQQEELDKVHENLALALEAGGVSAWMYDIKREMFFTLQGDTLAGEGLTMEQNKKILHPDDVDLCVGILDSLAKGEKQSESTIFRYLDQNSSIREYRHYESKMIAVKADGEIAYITGTQKDVTKEYSYQRELEQSNMRANFALKELQQTSMYNKLILDNTNSGFAFITTDFVVRWENISQSGGLSKFPSYREGDLCYKSVHGSDAPCTDCLMLKVLDSGRSQSEELILPTGEIISIFAIPVFGFGNHIDGVILRLDDVTEERKSYKELQEAKEKAERSDRFKSSFLANMSHEIRTPLNAIVGFSALMTEVESKEDMVEYSRIIAANNELLLKLINDILDLSKIEAGYIDIKNEDFDMVAMYDEISTTFCPRMPPAVELLCENPYDSCVVNLDRNRLLQVITNFITNAIKFTNQGYIKIGYQYMDGKMKVYVSDTGIGIAQDNLDSVFVRFEKLNDFAQGTGLGLSICKSIVEAQNGTIGIDSKLGEGSTFWAIFDCHAQIGDKQYSGLVESDVSLDNADLMEQLSVRGDVLVAEDNDSNYVLISSILKHDYNLTRAMNGEQAVQMARDNRYDVILMDMKMPVMDGIQATIKIREFHSLTPIIAVTANVYDRDRAQAFQAGCNAFLTKPIDKVKLCSILI